MYKNKVLIIDDSENVRDFLSRLLEVSGYDVFTAPDGLSGIDMITQIIPDLIFLDFNMPDINGVELLEQISPLKNKPYNIIMISGYHDDELTTKCYDLGVYFFLSKPFKKESVLTLAKQSIEEKNYRLRYENLYNSIHEGLVYYDKKTGRIFFVNSKFLEMFKLKKEQISDCLISEVLNIPDKMFENEELSETEDNYLTLERGDGSILETEISKSSFHLAHREGVVLLIKDITDLKKAEKELRDKNQLMLLQSRQAQMGEMMSMITHQWRQPLTAINTAAGMLDLMKKMHHDDPMKVHHLIETIYQQVEYLAETIEDFRKFFKQDKSFLPEELDSIIQRTLSLVKESIEKFSIKVVYKNQSVKKVSVLKNEIVQVLINILMNSKDELVEIEKEEKLVEITTKDLDDFAEITVFNNGPLIPKEYLEKIFIHDFTTKTEDKGTGLGLYMSKLIIEKKHNGKIYAENQNNGVKFIIRLPFDK